uniref:Uncharacterized protein n=1 Tax=Triticum urartu TaxID=4572 RepID=A0A8R7PRW7_TRIUA
MIYLILCTIGLRHMIYFILPLQRTGMFASEGLRKL